MTSYSDVSSPKPRVRWYMVVSMLDGKVHGSCWMGAASPVQHLGLDFKKGEYHWETLSGLGLVIDHPKSVLGLFL